MMFALSQEEANKLRLLIGAENGELGEWIKFRHQKLYLAIQANDSVDINQELENAINFSSNECTVSPQSANAVEIIAWLAADRVRHFDHISDNASRQPIDGRHCAPTLVRCQLNGHQLQACIDTGAQYSIIGRELVEKCGLIYLLDNRYYGIASGCGAQPIVGRIHDTGVQFGGHSFRINLLVVQQLRPDLIIIGNDFLVHQKCVIDCGRGAIYLRTAAKTISCATNRSALLTPLVCRLQGLRRKIVTVVRKSK